LKHVASCEDEVDIKVGRVFKDILFTRTFWKRRCADWMN